MRLRNRSQAGLLVRFWVFMETFREQLLKEGRKTREEILNRIRIPAVTDETSSNKYNVQIKIIKAS